MTICETDLIRRKRAVDLDSAATGWWKEPETTTVRVTGYDTGRLRLARAGITITGVLGRNIPAGGCRCQVAHRCASRSTISSAGCRPG
jgi:hypothetical protein